MCQLQTAFVTCAAGADCASGMQVAGEQEQRTLKPASSAAAASCPPAALLAVPGTPTGEATLLRVEQWPVCLGLSAQRELAPQISHNL